jgi:hypothetical protein
MTVKQREYVESFQEQALARTPRICAIPTKSTKWEK